MSDSQRERQQSVCRAVNRVAKAQATQDGAGVSLFRAIGQPSLQELDPFLLLDEMHSDRRTTTSPAFRHIRTVALRP